MGQLDDNVTAARAALDAATRTLAAKEDAASGLAVEAARAAYVAALQDRDGTGGTRR